MKKIYDKILLLLGIVVLGLGVGFVLSKGGIPVPVTPKTTMPPIKGKAYEAIPTPAVSDTQPEWQEPDPQDPSGWIYFVFTPPKIYRQGNEFTEDALSAESLPSFGMNFIGLKQQLYRLQFHSATGSGDDAVYSFSDADTGHVDVLKKGETSQDLKFKLISYNAGSKTEDGLTISNPSVIVQDLASNKQATLYLEQPAYILGKQYMLLQPEATPSKPWEVTKAGESLTLQSPNTGSPEIPEVDFSIKDLNFNFDNPTVTVVKEFTWKGKKKSQTEVLAASAVLEAPPPQTP